MKRSDHGFLIAFLALYLVLAVGTLGHYGITFDNAEYLIGDKNLNFYLTLDTEYLDYEVDNVPLHGRADHPDFYANSAYARQFAHHVWPLGPTASSLTKYVFFAGLGVMDPIDAHHLLPVLSAALLLATLFYFARTQAGPVAAMLAVLVLATYPRFWAHAHNNIKDVPSAALIAAVIILFHRGITKAGPLWVLAAGACWGLAMATKANALFCVFILGPWLAVVLWRRRREGHAPMPRRTLAALLASPFVGVIVALTMWPYLLVDFPANLVRHVQFIVKRGAAGPDHFQTMPFVNLLVTMPLPVLLLLSAGLAVIVRRTWRARRIDEFHLLLLLWLAVPVLRVSVPRANDFDVIRHWLEFLPAAATIAGIGGAALFDRLADRFEIVAEAPRKIAALGLALLALSPVLAWNVANHPNELLFYNSLVGGYGGARSRGLPGASDYWGSSYRQGTAWLNSNAGRGAVVVVGAAEHIVAYTAKIRLREDLLLRSIRNLSPAQVRQLAEMHTEDVYLMYVTRADQYVPFVEWVERQPLEPVHRITVDGGDVLKIYRIK